MKKRSLERLLRKDFEKYDQEDVAPKSFTVISEEGVRHYELDYCFGLVVHNTNNDIISVSQLGEDDCNYFLDPIGEMHVAWLGRIEDVTKRMSIWVEKFIKREDAIRESDGFSYLKYSFDIDKIKKEDVQSDRGVGIFGYEHVTSPSTNVIERYKDGGRIIVIVDYQYDFYNPSGSLYVPGGENLIDPLLKLIESSVKEKDIIIFTQDYHPKDHCSFIGNSKRDLDYEKIGNKRIGDITEEDYIITEGIWPSHCVIGDKGSEIDSRLLGLVKEKGLRSIIAKKGRGKNTEEYSAFLSGAIQTGDCKFDYVEYFRRPNYIEVDKEFIDTYDKEIIVCGLAGDYCVLETLKTLHKNCEEADLKVYMPGIKFIGETKEFDDFINKNNIEKYEL